MQRLLAFFFAAALLWTPAWSQSAPDALVPDLSQYILTPPAPPTPRINGAKVFGARPGSEFLFAIPASGDRPMTFAAEGLPKGLSLDPSTGFITGRVKKPGTYLVKLTARNALGEATRELRIVIGERIALTPPMGGAKGGSDFNPKGKSDREVMRFCQAFMTELWRHIGPQTDVPAGDIGVGGREIGYLYGMYRKLAQENTGVLTGKGMTYGGSLIRPEATGFGAVYFLRQMLEKAGMDIKGQTIAISGFGNVAWGAATKATELGAKVVTISGPDGYIYDPAGLDAEKIAYMLELRASNNDVVEPYAAKFPGSQFFAGKKPWEVKVDIAMPCATQNELDGEDAKRLLANGVKVVAEVSNMGCRPEAIDAFIAAKIPYGPGKAVNAGGVATSGLEMTQNSQKLNWTAEEVDAKLHQIMSSIHHACVEYGTEKDGYLNYMKGANIAGFMKVAKSMVEQGVL